MANMERLKEVRDFIAKLPPQACDMNDWFQIALMNIHTGEIIRESYALHEGLDVDPEWKPISFQMMKEKGFACGSAACICGWTEMMANQVTIHDQRKKALDGGYVTGQEYLDLDANEYQHLFCDFPSEEPDGGWKLWMIARLDECLAAGKITSWFEEDAEGEEEIW